MAEATLRSHPSVSDRVIRLFESGAVTPLRLGLAACGVLVGAFLASELLLGRHRLLAAEADPLQATRDARIAVVHCLLAVYLPLATMVVRLRTRANLKALGRLPGADAAGLDRLAAQVGRGRPAVVWSARLLGMILMIGVTYLTTAREYWNLVFDVFAMAPEVRWHRVLGLWVGSWTADYVRTSVAEARRISQSAVLLGPLDPLDPRPLAPYERQALSMLLASVGLGSLVSLFVFQGGYLILVSSIWGFTLAMGAVVLWILLYGIRRRIREAKQGELAQVRSRLAGARTALLEGRSAEPPLAELVAWEARIQAVREWPFDAGALTRIGLYGLIPLLSWSGGALVERIIDALLD